MKNHPRLKPTTELLGQLKDARVDTLTEAFEQRQAMLDDLTALRMMAETRGLDAQHIDEAAKLMRYALADVCWLRAAIAVASRHTPD